MLYVATAKWVTWKTDRWSKEATFDRGSIRGASWLYIITWPMAGSELLAYIACDSAQIGLSCLRDHVAVSNPARWYSYANHHASSFRVCLNMPDLFDTRGLSASLKSPLTLSCECVQTSSQLIKHLVALLVTLLQQAIMTPLPTILVWNDVPVRHPYQPRKERSTVHIQKLLTAHTFPCLLVCDVVRLLDRWLRAWEARVDQERAVIDVHLKIC